MTRPIVLPVSAPVIAYAPDLPVSQRRDDLLEAIGEHQVVDWISFSLAVAPADLNLTGYSYDGQFRVGFVSTPESMPEPQAFVDRLHVALDQLLAAAQGTGWDGADRAPRTR